MILETLWQYILIFLMAATPWLEILIVIPIGVAMGLNPLFVGVVSFAGNFLPILIIVYSLACFQQTTWFIRYKEKREAKRLIIKEQTRTSEATDQGQDSQELEKKQPKKSKKERAAAIFEKYGLPGLAFLGPIITGIHLAAIIALSLKSSKIRTTIWMGVSLVLWTVIITVASYYGLDWIINL